MIGSNPMLPTGKRGLGNHAALDVADASSILAFPTDPKFREYLGLQNREDGFDTHWGLLGSNSVVE